MDYIETKDGSTYVYSITDRGPNTSSYDFDKDGIKDRGFLLPWFTPEIVKLKMTEDKVEVVERIKIRLNKKRKVLGLPNQNRKVAPENYDETPFNSKRKKINFSRSGIDPEGIVRDGRENFWIVEEYGPSILKISRSGKVLKRFVPNVKKSKRFGEKKLPSFLGQRKLNRGFEGVTLFGDKLYAVLQSPLPFGKWKEEGVGHIIEFDIEKEETTGHYIYLFEKKGRKIGALSSNKKGELLVLEQNGKLGSDSFKKVFKINISDATNLLGKEFDHQKATRFYLKKMDYQSTPKSLFMDLDTSPNLTQHEKVEGMVLLPTEELLLAIDNDFGLGEVLNEETGQFNKVEAQPSSHFYRIKL